MSLSTGMVWGFDPIPTTVADPYPLLEVGQYREWMPQIAPPRLQTPFAQVFLGAVGAQMDETLARLVTTIRMRYPQYAAEDALNLIARARLLERFPAENLEDFRARVVAARQTWRKAGTELGLVETMSALGYTAVVYPWSAPNQSEFDVVLYPGRRTWDNSASERNRIVNVINKFKKADSRLSRVFYYASRSGHVWDGAGLNWDASGLTWDLEPVQIYPEASVTPPASPPVVISDQYQNFVWANDPNTIFRKPETGFRPGLQIGYAIGSTTLLSINWASYTGQSIYDVKAYISLEPHKSSNITTTYLNHLRTQLTNARNANMSITGRCWYTWSQTGTDATKAWVLTHIGQLSPLWAEKVDGGYADIITTWDLGFIGAWGELYYSLNFGAPPNVTWKLEVFDALCAAIPEYIRIAVRYIPRDMYDIVGTTSMTEAEAFNTGTRKGRVALFIDAWLSNQSWGGTFDWSNPARDQQRAYQQAQRWYMNVQVENAANIPIPTTPDPYNARTVDGFYAQAQWTAISLMAHDYWQSDLLSLFNANKDKLARNLGYRVRLTNGVLPTRLHTTSTFAATLTIRNSEDAFAPPIRQRQVVLVLTPVAGGTAYEIPLNSPEMRKWYPGTDNVASISQAMPAGIAPGQYGLSLHIRHPDHPTNPARSIRLANPAIWNGGTGGHDLAVLEVVA